MQNRRLVRGPGAWSPSNTLADDSGDNRAVPKRGPTNLDLECKESLQKLLKPANYPAILPWMGAASEAQKRDMVKLAQLAAGGGNGVSHPVSWLPQPREPVVMNDRGRVRHANVAPTTGDRVQHDLFKSKCGADVTNTALEKRRRYFANWAPIPSVDSVNDFFHLNDNAIAANPVCNVLTESAKRALSRWQVDGPELSAAKSAGAMRSLRSLNDACAQIPRYRDSVSCPIVDRSNWTPSRRTTRPLHVNSAPTLKPFVSDEEAAMVTKPGGFVVSLNDNEMLAKLKNRERNKSSKIPLAGGSTDYLPTSKAIGAHALK